jgi:hypothetical protein
MFKDILKNKLWITVLLLGIFIFSYFSAFAWEHYGGRYHFRDGRWYGVDRFGVEVAIATLEVGAIVTGLPVGYTTVVVGGVPYYYYDNIYYRPAPDGYVVVERPVTVVKESPQGFQPVVINGTTYYVNNGIYYIYTSYGYQVVQTPMSSVSVNTVSENKALSVGVKVSVPRDKGEPFVINVPNKHGGFTPVKLIKHGKGYVGPQGEYYEHPTVDQLKALYGE